MRRLDNDDTTRHVRLPRLLDMEPPMKPYPIPVEESETAIEPPTVFADTIRTMLAEDGPVIVTGWVVVAEYIDGDGSANVAAWASDDPPWRTAGLLQVGHELLDTAIGPEEDDE